MIKIKFFDIALTGVAFAALIFLLPPDQELPTAGKDVPVTSGTLHNDSKTGHQNSSETDILRTT